MKRFLLAVVALASLGLMAGRAEAGYEFRFATTAGTETTNFSLDYSASTTLDIRVYLVATGTEAATLSANGLKSYGVQLNYDGASSAKVVNTTPGITNNAAFTGVDGKAIENNGGLIDFARSRDNIATGSVASTTNGAEERVLLATFRFTGLTEGSTLAFSADPTGTTDTRLGDNTILDSLISGQSATITVTNVPEPGSLILTGILATGIIGAGISRARRRSAMMMA